MAHKLIWARRKAMGVTITPQEGSWIKYQLDLAHITQVEVARKVGCTDRMISHFIKGRKNSDRVKVVLAEMLGYSDFSALIAAARGQTA